MGNVRKTDDFAKFILRVTLGALMLFHGIAKLYNFQTLGFIKNQLVELGLHPVLAYGVFLGEIVAPALLIVGIYSRFGGFLIFINMLFAIVLVHANDWLSLTEHGGWALELQAWYLVAGLLVMLMGSGRIAIKPD